MTRLSKMSDARGRDVNEISATARAFLHATTNLYVEMLVRGRQVVAASLLQSIVLAMAHLRALNELPEGPERFQTLRKAARIVRGISMLIIYLAGSDSEIPTSLALDAIDAASDLSGAVRSAGAQLSLAQHSLRAARAGSLDKKVVPSESLVRHSA